MQMSVFRGRKYFCLIDWKRLSTCSVVKSSMKLNNVIDRNDFVKSSIRWNCSFSDYCWYSTRTAFSNTSANDNWLTLLFTLKNLHRRLALSKEPSHILATSSSSLPSITALQQSIVLSSQYHRIIILNVEFVRTIRAQKKEKFAAKHCRLMKLKPQTRVEINTIRHKVFVRGLYLFLLVCSNCSHEMLSD